MKKEKLNQPDSKVKESGAESNPKNVFKEGQKKTTFNSLDNVIESAVTNTKNKSGSNLNDDGTVVSYEGER